MMKEQISIISFTEQGYRLAKRMREALLTEGCTWPDSRMKTVRRKTGDFESGGEQISVCETKIVLYTKNRQNQRQYPESVCLSESLHSWCADIFPKSAAVIFIGAAGIAVRTIAPFLCSKTEDPAVLAADEGGRHIISLLSGHLGGGNALTVYLAEKLDADPVITTASDVGGKIAIDVWAQKNDLYITDLRAAKRIASRIVNGEKVPFYCEGRIRGELPPELILTAEEGLVDKAVKREAVSQNRHVGEQMTDERDRPAENVIVSVRDIYSDSHKRQNLHLVPKAVVLGIGCKKGKSCQEILDFVLCLLRDYCISLKSVCGLASIDRKAEEPGLCRLAAEWGVPFETFSAQTLRELPGTYQSSSFVYEMTGVDNVCERAAMAFLSEEERKNAHFLCGKTAGNGITAALLEKDWEVFFE